MLYCLCPQCPWSTRHTWKWLRRWKCTVCISISRQPGDPGVDSGEARDSAPVTEGDNSNQEETVWNMISELISTGWLYQLIQKHLQIYYTKLHYIDLYGPLMSLSHMDIWYLVSNNPKICQKSLEMTSRKKGKIFRVASIWHIFWSTDS